MYEKYSTRLRLVLYLPLDTHPRAVFPVHTRGSALTIPYIIVFLTRFSCQQQMM